MSNLSRRHYSGLIEASNDLGPLDADLHASRPEAAERGYLNGPQPIEVNDVMLLEDSRHLTAPKRKKWASTAIPGERDAS